MGNHVAVLICELMSLISLVCSQSFPYNPTTILLPQSSSDIKDIAYAFLPIPQFNTLHQLVSLNISSSISQSNLSLKTITPNLPFTSDDSVAFIPSISSIGEISVYTGSCSTSKSSALWRFTPSNTSTVGNGTWAQQTTNTAGDVTSAVLPGADFLSSGFSFSTLVHANASQTKMYIFGGMCPTSEATILTWQSASNYSNNMLRLAPTTSSSNTVYTLDIPSSRGPPIAEAGFTITGLTPTYSNGSDAITQQQNFVLLGGHTQSAFINMSQVAVWSLPEESWSFVTVDAPTTNGNTELTVKSTVTDVDSRSGHTAVLTEDGSKIVVLGGWVGDINQAAEPQLAVLDLGTGLGGTGDWKWSVPNEQPSGTGIYGHGAVMLPGNVMMVLGGHNITTITSKRAVLSTQAMFFNATSLTWSSDYTNPAYIAEIAERVSKSSSNSAKKKLGLGLGLGLGLAAILIAYGIFLWYSRRLTKKREEEREKDLGSGSGEPGFSHSHGRLTTERGGFPWAYGGWNGGDRSPNEPVYGSNNAVAGYENIHNGVHALGDGSSIPNPPRQIPRKALHSRTGKGMYQPMGFDFNSGVNHVRANSLGTAGPIHPIYEADEDDNGGPSGVGSEGVGVALGHPSAPGPSENRHSDPFRDLPTIVLPLFRQDSTMDHSPELESPVLAREREVQEWVTDWAAADALLNAQTRSHSHLGRVSPTRRAQLIAGSTVSSMSGEEDSGRTASNLSERSVAVSAMSASGSSSRSRSNSLRGFITNAMSPFSGTILSTAVASTNVSPVFDGPGGPHDARSFRPPGSAGSASGSTSTFNTAHTSFPALQAEGESLLPRPDDMSGGEYSPTRSNPDIPGSPSKSKIPARNRGQVGWLGSIRRAFVGDQGSGNASPASPHFPNREASPVRVDHDSGVQPRRTVSAGATLWRRKQGKGDWKDSADDLGMGGRSNTFTGDFQGNEPSTPGPSHSPYDEDDDEEWDIERAVENRVVQVMFTVPKEKLRVVNHDVNDDRSEVGSLRSKKGSAKSLKDVVMPPPLAEGVESSPPVPTHGQENTKGSPKGKGKVLEIVENLERRSSPER